MIAILLPHFALCTLLILISIPLILNRIGPNNFYGVRTARTLSDKAIWYKANQYGGWAILIASSIGAATLALAELFLPALLDYSLFVVLAPVVVALGMTLSYSQRVT